MPAVEEFGVEPIPAELRTVGWRDLFAILFTFNLSPLVYVLGAIAVTAGGLPLWWAAASIGLGTLVANLMLIVVARAGVDYGLPGQVAMRATFGQWGARGLTSPYRVAASSYWFAAQALAGAFGFQALIGTLTGDQPRLVPIALGLAAASALLAIVGFDALRYFVRVVLPLAVAFTAALVALYVASDEPAFSVSRVFDSPAQSFTWAGFATFVTVMWGGQLTVVTNVADFCRYARSRRHMQIGFLTGSTLGAFVAAWVGAYAAVAIGEVNPFAAAATLTDNRALVVLLLLAILAQTVSVNIMNVYTSGLSLVNTAPRLGRFAATALVSVAAVALAAFPDFINEAERWFTHLGNVAAPVTGVVLADYVVVKRSRIEVAELFDSRGRYRYFHGLNLAGALAVTVGVAVYYGVPDSWLKAAWGVVCGAAAYLALVRAQALLGSQTDRARRTSYV
jgi:NCS1 nucleoside transporter family